MRALRRYSKPKRWGVFPKGYIDTAMYWGKQAAPYVIQYLNNKRTPKGKYGVGVTNQYDRTNVYRKRRMPRRKRRRWRRFVKKVRAAENTTLGTRTRVYNDRIEMNFAYGLTNDPPQLFQSLALYSCNDRASGALAGTRRDLENIMQTDGDIAKTGSIQMKSGIFDMTLVNDSTDADGFPAGIELDVYLVTARKEFRWKTNLGTYVDGALEGALAEASNTMNPLGSASTPKVTDPGTTPFDMTASLSQFGIKILNKKKYFLPHGNQMTYQMRDPKNRTFVKDTILDMKGSNYPGATKHLLLVAKTLPGTKSIPTGTTNLHKVQLQVGVTRKYAYKLNDSNGDRAGTG